MNIKFLGLSGHLQSDAPGHYETFHRGILEGFQEVLGQSNARFLGSRISNQEDCWFTPLVPASMTSTISWLPKKFLNSLGADQDNNEDVKVLYIYEGNLANLFLLGRVARNNKNVFLYFNFFDSHKYSSILNSPFKHLLFKPLFLLATRRTDAKIQLVTDTEKFGQFLTRKLGKTFAVFPMYSGLKLSPYNAANRNVNLVNLRGVFSENLLKEVIDKNPELQNTQMEVHGVLNTEVAQYLENFPNIRVSNGHIDQDSYFTSYARYCKVAFIYDPKFFSMQSSGRLMDAVIAGASLIVPRGTSLEDALHEYGNGTVFDFENPKSLAQALLSEPNMSSKEKDLPTNIWAAVRILESINVLIEKSLEKEKSVFNKYVSYVLDEFIWLALWFLRLFFGFRNRISNSKNRLFLFKNV